VSEIWRSKDILSLNDDIDGDDVLMVRSGKVSGFGLIAFRRYDHLGGRNAAVGTHRSEFRISCLCVPTAGIPTAR